MRISIPLPTRLVSDSRADVVEIGAGATLEIGELTAGDGTRWKREAIESGVPQGSSVVGQPEETFATEAGWPYATVIADVVDGARIRERRLHAFFAFAYYRATVTLRGTAEAVAACEAEVRGLLAKAAPDFTEERPRSLFDVWDGV